MEKAKKSNNYHYNRSLQTWAKANKKTMTKSAACMWKYVLSNKQMLGYQFRRERPILNYIVDFVCLELLLVIEVDGITHQTEEAEIKDFRRDEKLRAVGFTVLRFSSWEVLNQISNVSNIIVEFIKSNATELPVGSPRRKSSGDNTSDLSGPPPAPSRGKVGD